MADDRKDVELRIKGKDDSAPAFKQATRNAENFTKTLTSQGKAAEAAASAAAENYSTISKRLDKAAEDALNARRRFDEFASSIAGIAEPTKAQVREFNSLGAAVDRADKQVAALQANLVKAQDKFNAKFSVLEQVMGSDAERAKAEQGSLRLASAIERVTEEQQQLDAAMNAQTLARDNAARLEAERGSYRLAEAIETVRVEQERLASLSGFRELGAQAKAAANDLSRFSATTGGLQSESARLSSSLLAIVDPARAARSSLEGLEGEVARVVAVVGEADKPFNKYQDAVNDLGRIQSDILKQGAMIDGFREQEAAVNRAQAAFDKARADVLRYASAVQTADAPNDQLAASLRQSEAALEAAGRELAQQQARLETLKGPLKAAKIDVNNLADAEKRLGAAAAQTAGAVGKLDAAMSGQNTKTGRFLGLKPYEIQNLGFQLNDVFTQLASGTSITQTFAQQGGQILQIFPGLFAKIVSFVPQLALIAATAGTAIAAIKRVADQESTLRDFAGDLALTGDRGRYNAEALTAQAQEMQRFGTSLKDARASIKAFIAEGLDPELISSFGQTAQNLADIMGTEVPEAAKKLAEGFTGGWEAVQKLDEATNFLTATEAEHIQSLFEDGEAQRAREEAYRIFQERAQEGADLSRGDWAEAARALRGAWDALLERIGNTRPIQDAITGLTSLANTVRDLLSVLPGGSAAGMAGTATQRSLQAANTELQKLKKLRADAEDTGKWLFNVAFKDDRNIPQLDAAIAKTQAKIDQLTASSKQSSEQQAKAGDRMIEQYQRAVKPVADLTDAERLLRAEQEARTKAQAANLSKADEAQVVSLARQAEQLKITKENAKEEEAAARKRDAASRKAAAAARRDAAAAQAAENRRQATENQLLADMRAMDIKVARQQKSSLEDRLEAIDTGYAKIYDNLKKFESQGGVEVNGQDLASFRAKLASNVELLKQQETLKYYEDQTKAFEEDRKDRLTDIENRQAAGLLTSAQAYEEAKRVQTELGPLIEKNADEAIRFAEALNATNPSPQLTAFINAMKEARSATGADVKKTGLALLADEEKALNVIIQERNALVAANNDLFEAGIISADELRTRNEAAYNAAVLPIQNQIIQFQSLLNQLNASGVITDQMFATWLAKLQLIGQQTQYVDILYVQMKATIEDTILNGGLQLFDTFTTSLGQLIDGTISFNEAIRNVGNSFRQFAADFLRQIAMMILKQMILNALQKSAGGGGIGGIISKGVVGVLSRHTGGMANRGPKRMLPADLFINAPRYHSGTPGVGLSANEQAAVLKKNEEVLTADDPRHINNLRYNKAMPVVQTPDIKIVNTIDPQEFVSAGLGTRPGQQAVINAIRSNSAAVKAALGV